MQHKAKHTMVRPMSWAALSVVKPNYAPLIGSGSATHVWWGVGQSEWMLGVSESESESGYISSSHIRLIRLD